MSLWNVPLADIDLSDDEIRAVTDVLRSKWLSMGPVTAEFERQFAIESLVETTDYGVRTNGCELRANKSLRAAS